MVSQEDDNEYHHEREDEYYSQNEKNWNQNHSKIRRCS